jgi:flagellar motor component MotA
MTIVEFLLLFIIGGFFGGWWFGVIILPIFYGLPRSLYWIHRKTLKAKAVLFYLGTFVFWTAIFTGTAIVLTEFFPSVRKYLYNSQGFAYGQLLGVIVFLIRAFSKSGRKELSDDFWAAMAKYKKHSDEAMRRKALEEILKVKNEGIDQVLKNMLCLYIIGQSEEEITKNILEEFKKDNVPEEWTQELLEAFKRKVEEYRSKKLKK